MGTKAKCIKCGKEHWVNTGKLHHIRLELGIRPSEWIKTRYMCLDCKKRVNLIKKSTVESITEKLNGFSIECRSIFSGYFSGKKNESINKLKQKLTNEGLNSYSFVKYKNVVIGVEVYIPIIGNFMISLLT